MTAHTSPFVELGGGGGATSCILSDVMWHALLTAKGFLQLDQLKVPVLFKGMDLIRAEIAGTENGRCSSLGFCLPTRATACHAGVSTGTIVVLIAKQTERCLRPFSVRLPLPGPGEGGGGHAILPWASSVWLVTPSPHQITIIFNGDGGGNCLVVWLPWGRDVEHIARKPVLNVARSSTDRKTSRAALRLLRIPLQPLFLLYPCFAVLNVCVCARARACVSVRLHCMCLRQGQRCSAPITLLSGGRQTQDP